MSHRYILSLVVVLSFGIRLVCADDLKSSKLRKFEFTYQVKLEGLKPSQAYRLWIPMPSSNSHQEVSDLVTDPVEKLPGKVTIEPRFGNRIRYIEGVADAQGMATCDCTYSIVRKEVTGEGQAPTEAEAAKFLQADKLVPIEGKPLTLIEGKILPKNRMELGRVLYDSVNTHMKYSKEGTGWGRGDSNWACDNKFGNCSDFHSLFISLSRAQKCQPSLRLVFPYLNRVGPVKLRGIIAGPSFNQNQTKAGFQSISPKPTRTRRWPTTTLAI